MTSVDKKTLDKIANYSLNKKDKKRHKINTRVKVKSTVSHKLLPVLEKEYDSPKRKKDLEGKIVAYMNIPNRKELFPIVEFADKTKSIFFEYDLFIVGFDPESEEVPILTLKPKKLPKVPDFLK